MLPHFHPSYKVTRRAFTKKTTSNQDRDKRAQRTALRIDCTTSGCNKQIFQVSATSAACDGIIGPKVSSHDDFEAGSGGDIQDLTSLSAVKAVELLCNREVTATQYAKALLHQAGELRCLNTFSTMNSSQVHQNTAPERQAIAYCTIKLPQACSALYRY